VQSALPQCNDTFTQAFVHDNDDVCKAIKRLQQTKSIGLDGIPGFVVKVCFEIPAPLLTFTFNLSFFHTDISCCMEKKAVIVPIYKNATQLILVITGLLSFSILFLWYI
jgi:hypothetical protein